MTTKEMLNEIRKIIGRCDASEHAVMEALVDESECWRMRLEELEDEEEGDDDAK